MARIRGDRVATFEVEAPEPTPAKAGPAPKRKPGRPRVLPVGEVVRLTVPVSRAQADELRSRADGEGLSVSAFIRKRLDLGDE